MIFFFFLQVKYNYENLIRFGIGILLYTFFFFFFEERNGRIDFDDSQLKENKTFILSRRAEILKILCASKSIQTRSLRLLEPLPDNNL